MESFLIVLMTLILYNFCLKEIGNWKDCNDSLISFDESNARHKLKSTDIKEASVEGKLNVKICFKQLFGHVALQANGTYVLQLGYPLTKNKNTDDEELDRSYKFREAVGADTANEALKRRNYKLFIVTLYHILHEVSAGPHFIGQNNSTSVTE